MVNSKHVLVGLSILAGLAPVAACNVSATAPPTTGGVGPIDAGNTGDDGPIVNPVGDAGTDGVAPDGATEGGSAVSCPAGDIVLLTDYTSTQIALSTLEGTTESASFLSTASTTASGLAYALSGDVVLPAQTPPSGRVVLIDQYGTNVLTWADPSTAKVYAQLPIGTGFESNPYDYYEFDATSAYVSRWGVNDSPGTEPFDNGSDLLIVNTQTPAVIGSLAMPVENSLPPRPAHMLGIGSAVLVALQFISEDFTTYGTAAIVGVQNGAIAWEVHVNGLQNCDYPTLSPSGKTMAIACAGGLDANGNVVSNATTGIALYDVTTLPPTYKQTVPVYDQLGSTVQNQVTWVSETMLMGKTQTPVGGPTNNELFTFDLVANKAMVLLTASPGASGGKGLVYDQVLCRPGCGNVCILCDSDVGKLRVWSIDGNTLTQLSDIEVDPSTGLPPNLLGGYN
jgi:hypothetical protein